jgi:hypothetical protein
MYEISAVTLLIGLSTPLSPQLTRRIIQVVIHSQYNAVTFVSCLKKRFFGHLFIVNCVATGQRYRHHYNGHARDPFQFCFTRLSASGE